MIDITSAKASAIKLVQFGAWNISNLYSIASKADPDTQNEGTYNLIFPYLHIDFPTREEVFNMVTETFDRHDKLNLHNGDSYNPRTPGATIVLPPRIEQKETINSDGISVKALSPVNAIGYGV